MYQKLSLQNDNKRSGNFPDGHRTINSRCGVGSEHTRNIWDRNVGSNDSGSFNMPTSRVLVAPHSSQTNYASNMLGMLARRSMFSSSEDPSRYANPTRATTQFSAQRHTIVMSCGRDNMLNPPIYSTAPIRNQEAITSQSSPICSTPIILQPVYVTTLFNPFLPITTIFSTSIPAPCFSVSPFIHIWGGMDANILFRGPYESVPVLNIPMTSPMQLQSDLYLIQPQPGCIEYRYAHLPICLPLSCKRSSLGIFQQQPQSLPCIQENRTFASHHEGQQRQFFRENVHPCFLPCRSPLPVPNDKSIDSFTTFFRKSVEQAYAHVSSNYASPCSVISPQQNNHGQPIQRSHPLDRNSDSCRTCEWCSDSGLHVIPYGHGSFCSDQCFELNRRCHFKKRNSTLSYPLGNVTHHEQIQPAPANPTYHKAP